MIELGVSANELTFIVIVLLAGGCATGFIAGLLGIGGGGIMVPILYEVFSILGVDPAIRMQMSIGTALAVMIPTSLQSFWAHASRGAADMDIVRRLALPVMLGVVGGSVIAKFAHSDTFKWVWIVCCTVLAAKMLFGREHWRLGNAVPRSRWLEVYEHRRRRLHNHDDDVVRPYHPTGCCDGIRLRAGRCATGSYRFHVGRLGAAGFAAAIGRFRQSNRGGDHGVGKRRDRTSGCAPCARLYAAHAGAGIRLFPVRSRCSFYLCTIRLVCDAACRNDEHNAKRGADQDQSRNFA